MPLRPVFSAPPSAAASGTNAAAQPAASARMSSADEGDPSSSSPVTSTVTPSRSTPAARNRPSAVKASTSPPFMSKQPRPAPPPAGHRQGQLGERAERPHGVGVAEHQHPPRSGPEPPAQMGAAVDDEHLRLGAQCAGALPG